MTCELVPLAEWQHSHDALSLQVVSLHQVDVCQAGVTLSYRVCDYFDERFVRLTLICECGTLDAFEG